MKYFPLAMQLLKKWKLALKVIPFLVVIVICKFGIHSLGYEFLSLNAIFAAIISANIFLLGFMLSGVLVDYKEGEKLPGDIACSIETILDECLCVYETKKSESAKNLLVKLKNLTDSILQWFYKKEKTGKLLEEITELNKFFVALNRDTETPFISRIKLEQNLLRKMIVRIHTIRETSFVDGGYAIAELVTTVLSLGLIFIKFEPFYEGVFFVSFVSFILIYMIFFIKDLDNPFGYYEHGYIEDVSLKPVLDTQKRLDAKIKELEK